MAILLADIGGTHARLTYLKANKIGNITVLNCDDYETPIKLLQDFVKDQKISGIILSVAGPVENGKIQWSNRSHWKLSESELKKKFNIKKAMIVNDMVAQGYGLKLPKTQKALLMNVGTGMGSSLILDDKVYPCEFGLVLSKTNHKQEYLISGSGIVRIYHQLGGDKTIRSAKLLDEMRGQGDKKAINAYKKFYELWGATAGNIATGLMVSCVYLWGGLTPKNKKDMQDFIRTFHNEKLPKFNQKIAVKIVRKKSLALNGLANLSIKKF